MEHVRTGGSFGGGPAEPEPDVAEKVTPVSRRRAAAKSGREIPVCERRDNLPAPLTTFVGREPAIAEVAGLVGSHRLVTLAGAPGVGKSRLAVRVAEEVRKRFRDGAWLVELAALAEPALVPPVVARQLGLRDEPGRPPDETLAEYLESRELLLVLDNCEHLLDASAGLADTLLRASEGLRILATSREQLGLVGEVAWRVPSLTVPTMDDGPSTMDSPEPRTRRPSSTVHRLLESEAGRLFVERVRASVPSFEATESRALAVAEICRRLDGIPLAIELAAARGRALSPDQIAARLDDRFGLLVGGSRTALPRHRTLRATVDWSHGLLSADEQALLRRLAVFAGGWTLEAAEAITGVGYWVLGVGEGEGVHPTPNTLDLLTSLVDKSLVLAEERPGGSVRYRMLETLRAYAAERLRESGEGPIVREQHQRWFLELAEQDALRVIGPARATWLAVLQAELDNIRAALAWPGQAPEANRRSALERALRLGATLAYFWDVGGQLTEGRGWLSELLQAASTLDGAGVPPVDDLARGRALVAAGYLAFATGDGPAAGELLAEAVVRCRAAGDGFYLAWALGQLGAITLFRGELDRAAELIEEAVGIDLSKLEWSPHAGAWQYWLGEVEFARGNRQRALSCWEASIPMARDHGIVWGVAYGLSGLARVAFLEGDHDRAARLHGEALEIRRELDVRGIAFSLAELAWARVAQGRAEQAALLLGAADAGREQVGVSVVLLRDWHSQHEQAIAAAQGALGEAAFEAAYARGRALPLEGAVTLALQGEGPARPAGPPATPGEAAGGLTRREREVAGLVAAGRTNQQIAEALVVSERTVEWHVANILGKLGVQTRAQVAVWALEHELTPSPDRS